MNAPLPLAATAPSLAIERIRHPLQGRHLQVVRRTQVSPGFVRLTLAGPDGAVQERQVRVMAVEPGRVRLRDVVRETELTVAVHRIVSVEAN